MIGNISNESKLKILYYGAGWPTNIGNAFLDIGAMAILKNAVPDAQIYFASEMPRWFFNYKSPKYIDNALDIASMIKCDLVVIAGMAMCESFINVNGHSLFKLRENETQLLLLGTGGGLYDKNESEKYKRFLKEIEPLAFISRDKISFNTFSSSVKNSYEGIDCGFFMPLGYEAPELNTPPYVVFNFDSSPLPKIEKILGPNHDKKIIYSHHECWGEIPIKLKNKKDTLVSDIPQDYITLYANCKKVYSDRVHACVAALAYGREAQLFDPTPRGSLFEAAGVKNIRENNSSLCLDTLSESRNKQINLVSKIIGEHFNK